MAVPLLELVNETVPAVCNLPTKARVWLVARLLLLAVASQCLIACLGDDLTSPPSAAEACSVAAQKAYARQEEQLFGGIGSVHLTYLWSRRWMEADQYRSPLRAKRVAAAENHLVRTRDMCRCAKERVAAKLQSEKTAYAADYYLADAELLLDNTKNSASVGTFAATVSKTRARAARQLYDSWWQDVLDKSLGSAIQAYAWSRSLMEAEMAANMKQVERLAVAEAYLRRSNELEKAIKDWFGEGELTRQFLTDIEFHRADAQITVYQEQHDAKGDKLLARALKARVMAAEAGYNETWTALTNGDPIHPESLYSWSCEWRNAVLAVAGKGSAKVAAMTSHLKRMKDLQAVIQKKFDEGVESVGSVYATAFYSAQAEVLLHQIGS